MNSVRWRNLALTKQMGHITSEITRARIWEGRGDSQSRNEALKRVLELIDLTLDCYRQSRRRELLRLREVVCHCLIQSDWYDIDLLDLQHYGERCLSG